MSDQRNPFEYGIGRFLQPPANIAPTGINRLLGLPDTPASPFGFPMTSGLGHALGLPGSPPSLDSIAAAIAVEQYRRRLDWNARFEHWEKPASLSEEGTIDRAWRNVQDAVEDSLWLTLERVSVQPQGSYHNNTNTRRDADIDLRVRHPLLKIDYGPDVIREYADASLAYTYPGASLDQVFAAMRLELQSALSAAFGSKNVVPGKKAIRVKGITGSRAEVDVVPTVGYHKVVWSPLLERYLTLEGVAILSTDGGWTLNFPDHHHANGVSKRDRTSLQFKKTVRIFKRLRADMIARGILKINVPSFLVECLVYAVEDGHFTVVADDRYGRVRRVAKRLQQMLNDEPTAAAMLEINEVKPLFTAEQAWSWREARIFINTAVAHLGDA